MSIVDTLVGTFRKFVDREGAGFGDESTAQREKRGTLTEWYYMAFKGMGTPRKENLTFVREIAKTTAVRIVIDTLLKELRSTPWTIRAKDIDDLDENLVAQHIELIEKFMAKPNFNDENLDDLISAFANDVLEVDAGVFVKVFDTAGDLAEIYARDGASFLKAPDVYGVMPLPPEAAYWQYSFKQPTGKPIGFTRNEIAYGMLNPKSYSAYGWSPVQSIKDVLEPFNNSLKWNKLLFENNAIPDGLISILDENTEGLERFKNIWKKELTGKPHKMMFWNKEMNFKSFIPTAREMEYLESQKWYLKLVASAFGVSPNEIGITDTVNKATGEVQERITIKRALRPLLELVEQTMTNQIIAEIKDLQGNKIEDVEFKYLHVDIMEEQRNRLNEDRDLKNGVITINQIRAKRGDEPVAWGEVPFRPGSVAFGAGEQFVQPTQQKKRPTFSSKPVEKALTMEEIIGPAKDYASFIYSELRKWEKKTLAILDKPQDEWMKAMTGMKILDSFVAKLRRFVKQEVMVGVDQAEKELNMDIGFNETVQREVEIITDQQIGGYRLPDGKKWHGIKGMTEETQVKLFKEIKNALAKGESLSQIKGRVKSVFDVSESRAMAIARTETNRMLNSGHLQGYISSGFSGKKQWMSFLDNRTTPICKRLDEQTVDLTETFKDADTGGEFQAPPAHVNCRSRIIMLPDGEQ